MEADESPSSSTFLIHPFTPSNLSLDEHPTSPVIVTALQDAEFRGSTMVC